MRRGKGIQVETVDRLCVCVCACVRVRGRKERRLLFREASEGARGLPFSSISSSSSSSSRSPLLFLIPLTPPISRPFPPASGVRFRCAPSTQCRRVSAKNAVRPSRLLARRSPSSLSRPPHHRSHHSRRPLPSPRTAAALLRLSRPCHLRRRLRHGALAFFAVSPPLLSLSLARMLLPRCTASVKAATAARAANKTVQRAAEKAEKEATGALSFDADALLVQVTAAAVAALTLSSQNTGARTRTGRS